MVASGKSEQQLINSIRSPEVWYSTAQRVAFPEGPKTAIGESISRTVISAAYSSYPSYVSKASRHDCPSRATYPLKSRTAKRVADSAPSMPAVSSKNATLCDPVSAGPTVQLTSGGASYITCSTANESAPSCPSSTTMGMVRDMWGCNSSPAVPAQPRGQVHHQSHGARRVPRMIQGDCSCADGSGKYHVQVLRVVGRQHQVHPQDGGGAVAGHGQREIVQHRSHREPRP